MNDEKTPEPTASDLNAIVMWRDLEPGERIKAGDRMLTPEFTWRMVDEEEGSHEFVFNVQTYPTQRRAS